MSDLMRTPRRLRARTLPPRIFVANFVELGKSSETYYVVANPIFYHVGGEITLLAFVFEGTHQAAFIWDVS